MGDKLPVRIYLREETIEALKKAAEDATEEMTYNEVAAEIVTRFLPAWVLARVAFDDAIEGVESHFRQLASEAKARRKLR